MGRPATPAPGANGARPNLANGLTPYQPPDEAGRAKAMSEDERNFRERARIPDYVRSGEEQDFFGLREELRNEVKYSSEEELNELASKRWEEKKGVSPEMLQFRKQQEVNRKLNETIPGKPGAKE
jgi:hypothetical protein